MNTTTESQHDLYPYGQCTTCQNPIMHQGDCACTPPWIDRY